MKRVLLLLSLIGMMLGAHANEEHEKYHPKETDDYITINDVTVVPGSNEKYYCPLNRKVVRPTP